MTLLDLGRDAPGRIDRSGGVRPALRRQAARIALFSGDVAGLVLVLGLLAASGASGAAEPQLLRLVAVSGGLCLAIHAGQSLYPGYRLHPQEILRRRLTPAIFAGAGSVAVAALVLGAPAMVLPAALAAVLVPAVQLVLRWRIRAALHRAGLWGEAVEIRAPAAELSALTAYFKRNWHYGVVPAGPGDDRGTVLLAGTDLPGRDELLALQRRGGRAILLADMPDRAVSGLQPAQTGGQIGLVLGGTPRDPAALARRAFDLAIALPALLVALPFVLLAGLAIRLVDAGPVFYRQAREGRNGAVIRVLKLRTMYGDAEARLTRLLANDPEAQAEWSRHFKLRDDPRILPVVGRVLRMTSADELPQLVNILTGEMAVVGPRPFPDYHLSAMDPEFRSRRARVTPGLTGLWQVSDRSTADLGLQRQLDDFYLANRSIWFDLHIVLSTFRAVLGSRGAY